MAVTLEHYSTRAQHSFAIRGAHAGAAAGCQNWLARACGLSMRSDPSGWSPRVHPMDGLFLLLRSLSPGRRSTVAVTLEHNGTRAPHSFATHEAHAGAAAGCQIGWLAPEGLVHARGSERLESRAHQWTDCFCEFEVSRRAEGAPWQAPSNTMAHGHSIHSQCARRARRGSGWLSNWLARAREACPCARIRAVGALARIQMDRLFLLIRSLSPGR